MKQINSCSSRTKESISPQSTPKDLSDDPEAVDGTGGDGTDEDETEDESEGFGMSMGGM